MILLLYLLWKQIDKYDHSTFLNILSILVITMAEAFISKEVVKELKAIRKDLDYIKEHMVDVDTILTPEEEARLEESLREYKEGRTTKLEDFEKEIVK